MRTLGLLGGMSWQSTISYYHLINRIVVDRLGGFHSAKILLLSVDFAEIEVLMSSARWSEAGEVLAKAARTLEAAGAELLVLCTNTLHKVAPQIEERVGIPFLHIVDAAAREVQRAGMRRVGLLATRFTMEQDFYRERLASHGIETVIPVSEDRAIVHRVIFEELVRGRVEQASRREMRRIATTLATEGAEAVVLGCTELAMVLEPGDVHFRLIDTTQIHAREAAEWALAGSARSAPPA
jgi:aspartate racemase